MTTLRHFGALKISSAFMFLFSIFSFLAPQNTFAAAAANQGPASVKGTLVTGVPQTVYATFTAPVVTTSKTVAAKYMLDTEVFSAATGTRVSQFYEVYGLNSQQSVTRTYTWDTAGLKAGNYIFKQGLFTSDWKTLLSWNDAAGSATLTGVATATWTNAVTLLTASPLTNSVIQLSGSFGVATSGSYILDMEVFNAANTRVGQYYETRTLVAGVNQAVNWNWAISTAGTYKVKLGIFTTDWQLKNWNDNALPLTVTASAVTTPLATTYQRGINLAGADFGEEHIPGVYGTDYTYPTASELDYYKSKGLTLIRLPFRWERVQPTLMGSLNATELARIDAVVAAAKARQMQIILDPHNYDRYRLNGTEYLIGSKQVPNAAFQDFWTKMAYHFKSQTAIYAFGLMNEPHDTNNTWGATAQAGLNGIRSVDLTHLVLVPGDGWSGAWSWQEYNSNLLLVDPANKLMYEAHQYFDHDKSGKYAASYDAEGAYPTIGVDRVQPFIDWLKAHNLQGFIGEYGIPNDDARWQTVLDNFLTKLDSEGIGGTYWAGGPWWGSYSLSAEPVNGKDKPVMSVLVKHLSKN